MKASYAANGHTLCSHLAMRGGPPRAIQELAGHRELGMSQRYMHLTESGGAGQRDPAARSALGLDRSLESWWRRGGVTEEKINGQNLTGGEAGIRTLGTGFSPYNGLANRRLQPLGHLTV
jgi:integrase-like protein